MIALGDPAFSINVCQKAGRFKDYDASALGDSDHELKKNKRNEIFIGSYKWNISNDKNIDD